MGFPSKQFDTSTARPASSGDGVSVLAMLMDMGIAFKTQKCGVDGRTFPCPEKLPNVFGGAGMALDIGGYCPRCRDWRCERHVRFGELRIHCAECGTELTNGQ